MGKFIQVAQLLRNWPFGKTVSCSALANANERAVAEQLRYLENRGAAVAKSSPVAPQLAHQHEQAVAEQPRYLGIAASSWLLCNERMEFRFFDPTAALDVSRRNLPHWEQQDAYYFLTWRTADSIPAAVLEQWQRDRCEWLLQHGIDPELEDWQLELENLPEGEHQEFYRKFTGRWHEMLDACHGECVLRRPDLRGLVAQSLHSFDGQRYVLEAFVVMPNHVHALAGIAGQGAMKKLCRSWKHYTATKLNEILGRRGQFWQWESFDHIVRGRGSLEKFRQYIIDNPTNAQLKPEEYDLWVK